MDVTRAECMLRQGGFHGAMRTFSKDHHQIATQALTPQQKRIPWAMEFSRSTQSIRCITEFTYTLNKAHHPHGLAIRHTCCTPYGTNMV